ncbi:MAG TPA: trypsin-like peptidase domain-containing protein [Ktedonobacteraceae bacterium]|nr:trypsin-like peptidase domain-containing protein [Ktedonobacteraceae bacterium]
MIQEEHGFYNSYPFQSQDSSSAPTAPLGTVSEYTGTHVPSKQVETQLDSHPSGPLPAPNSPMSPIPPQKRPGRTALIVIIILVLAIIFGLALFAAGWEYAYNGNSGTTGTTSKSPAASSSSNTVMTQQEAAIAKIEPSVVELAVTTAQGQQIGSGVIIDANGDIVTNNHVVNGEQSIKVVLYNGKTEQAQLVGTVAADDLAVVRIIPFAHMTVAQIGNSSQLSVGQEVLAIGNPLGITETATHGIISALNRSVTESTGVTISQAIQTDAPINPGNSGGALINLQGQLIGIPTLTAIDTQTNTPANGVGFAIPSNLVKTALTQILQQG